MSFEWNIAMRYLWSRRRHPFVGVINLVSILGISLGVAILIIVMSVMNGFDEDLKERLIGLRAHVIIEKEAAFTEGETVMGRLSRLDGVKGVAPFVQGEAVVQKGRWGAGVLVRGVSPDLERSVTKTFDSFREGSLAGVSGSVAVGSVLADKAGLEIGSEISLLSNLSKKPAVMKVTGIFSSGLYEYDERLVFMRLADAQTFFGMGDALSGVSVALRDADRAPQVKKEIQSELGYPFVVQTWMDMNRSLLGALRLEKTVMFLILALVVLVASLNIAGSLTILVIHKTRDIGVMKALGATPLNLMKIFAWNGLALGLGGAFCGGVLGAGVCALLKNYPVIPLPKDIYFGIDRLPVVMNSWDVTAVLGMAVGLSSLFSFYPAAVAGRLDPVKALRYE
ncbi:MAG: ABC transporter permease [Candidatus Omnitrophica bacterium]|nr:ABC transporter permease [Candidatus Omnitrophota bacterium]